MKHFLKQPLTISAGLLGLTLAVTGCSTTTNHNDTKGAQPMMPHKGMGEHHEKMGFWHHGEKDGMSRRMDNLNLTDAQKAQIQQLRTQNQAKMQQFHATLQQYDANIAAQKKAGASATTLLGLYQQKQAVMDQAFAMHKQSQQQFMSILTPEQQLKLYENQDRGMGMRGDRDDKRPPMPPMPQQNGQSPRPN